MKRPSFAWLSPGLTAISKRFGFDAHYFAKNSIVVTCTHAFAVLRGLVTGYLVTYFFAPDMYGEYRFVLSAIGMASVVGLSALPSAIANAIAQKEPVSVDRISRWYSSVLLIGAVLLAGCIAILPQWNSIDLWPLFVAAAVLFIPAAVANNVFTGIVRGTGTFTLALRASFQSNILIVVTVLIMLLVHPSALLLLVLTTAIPAVIYLWHLIPLERVYRTNASQTGIKRMAFKMSLAVIPSTASWYIDGVIISGLFGLNQLALFSVAMLIPEQMKYWVKEMLPVLYAKQAGGKDSASKRKKMDRAVIVGTALFAAGILGYVLLAPFIIPLLFPHYPADQLIPLTCVAAVTLLALPATIYPQFLEARGMIRQLQWCNWISATVQIIALLTLAPTMGLMGAVIARGLYRFVSVGAAFVIIRRLPVNQS